MRGHIKSLFFLLQLFFVLWVGMLVNVRWIIGFELTRSFNVIVGVIFTLLVAWLLRDWLVYFLAAALLAVLLEFCGVEISVDNAPGLPRIVPLAAAGYDGNGGYEQAANGSEWYNNLSAGCVQLPKDKGRLVLVW